MKIEIWSDPICVFSYIGKSKLKRVLKTLGLEKSVFLEWNSFMLNPDYRPRKKVSFTDFLREGNNMSRKQACSLCMDFQEIADTEGLKMNFDRIIPCNTYNAHRLLKKSKEYNLQNEMVDALFTGFFEEGRNLNQISVLTEIGSIVGIPETSVIKLFDGCEYISDVRKDMERAHQLRLFLTPGFYIDRKLSVIGYPAGNSMEDLFMTMYEQHCTKQSFLDKRN
jgi:protein disulfide-isomerase